MVPDEEDPASGSGQQPQGDPQEVAQDTSGVPEDGEEMAGNQTCQGEDAAHAQTHHGAATSKDANIEDQAPPRGASPLRQPPSTGNVL